METSLLEGVEINLLGSEIDYAVSPAGELLSFAIGALPPDGYLATPSCSHHISREDFVNILCAAAAQARRKAVLVELRGQAKDHPILLNMPETEYLHFALLKII